MYALLIAAAEPAAAGPLVPPDPATVQAPGLANDPWQKGNPKKFYVFHREGGTFQEAWHDLAVCLSFANQPQFAKPTDHVEWTQPVGKANNDDTGLGYAGLVPPTLGGVVGGLVVNVLIGAPIAAGLGRSLRQLNMSSCMLPRGYTRYLVSEDMWRRLNGKDMMKAISMQAKIAGGPKPLSPVVPQ